MYKKEAKGMFINYSLGTCIYKEAEKRWVIEIMNGVWSPFRIVTPCHKYFGTKITGIRTLREAKALDLFWSIYDMRKARPREACLNLGTLYYEFFTGKLLLTKVPKEEVKIEQDEECWLPGLEPDNDYR